MRTFMFLITCNRAAIISQLALAKEIERMQVFTTYLLNYITLWTSIFWLYKIADLAICSFPRRHVHKIILSDASLSFSSVLLFVRKW